MPGLFYDRQGNPMTVMEWALKQEKDKDYVRVAETSLPDGTRVSTVWIGVNLHLGHGPPLIFETMVFRSEGKIGDLDCQRYATEGEAKQGHEEMVQRWSN